MKQKVKLSHEAKQLENVLDFFFTTQTEEMEIVLKDPVIITREEYEELIGYPDSTWGSTGNDGYTYDDEYVEVGENGEERVLKVLIKLNIKYDIEIKEESGKEKELIKIYEIYGWREYVEWEHHEDQEE